MSLRPAAPPLRTLPLRARGFTLIELMTAVIVAAVLLAVAGPGLGSFIRSSRVNAAQSELVSSMMLARSEAAKRGQDVQLIAANRTSGTDFSAGWVVWWDRNGDGIIDASAAAGEVLRSYPAPSGGAEIRTAVAASAVRFAPTGFLSPPSALVFRVCGGGPAPSKGYRVELQPVGLTDVSTVTDCP